MSNFTPPSSYKVAVVKEAGKPFEIEQRKWQELAPGMVAVRVLACGVCHSDAIAVHAQMGVQLPRVPGHEIVGEVVQVHADEKLWKVGQRVGSGWHGGHCGICTQCRKGDFVTCKNETINGILSDGGYAEYAFLRTEAIARIPEEIDPAEAAPLLCAGVTVYNSMRNMDSHPGDIVAIQGVGGLGHLAIQFARQMGFHTVAVSRGSSKEKLARELGAHTYIDSSAKNAAEELQKLGGAKLVVAVAPSGKAMQELIGGLGVNGQLVILAVADDLQIPCAPMIQKRLKLVGWPSGTAADSEDTVAFAQHTGVKTHIERYSLDDVNKAYNDMMDGKVHFRAVLVPDAK